MRLDSVIWWIGAAGILVLTSGQFPWAEIGLSAPLHPSGHSIAVTPASPPALGTTEPAIEKYQTLVAAAAALFVGILSVLNALIQTWINSKNNRREATQKKLAFFATVETDLSALVERLSTSKEVLEAIDFEQPAPPRGWVPHLRLASRIGPLSSLELEWEKLAVIGSDNIRRLRRLSLALTDLERSFTEALADQETLRSQPLPLLDRMGRDDSGENLPEYLESISEQVESALTLAQDLLEICANQFRGRGKNGLATKDKQ